MFTPEFLTLVAGYGVAVIGIVQLVKKMLKVDGWIAVVISIIASFVVTLPSLSANIPQYLILVVCVALEANGIFKAVHS